mgnify:CR=1 FL=1
MTSYICVDASVAAKWVLPEDYSKEAVELYLHSVEQGVAVVAPPHLRIEVVNVIRRQVVLRSITYTQARDLLRTFLRYSVSFLAQPSLYEQALDLAETYNRPTVYDTQYVALASIMGCDLWTADERLVNALGGSLPFVKLIRDYPG